MKPVSQARRALLAALIAGTTIASAGCSSSGGFSMASMNPFARSQPDALENGGSTPGMTDTIASAGENAKGGVTAIAASARSAVGKTTDAITGVFLRPKEEDDSPAAKISDSDPLSLANMPENAGAEVHVANGQLWESSGDTAKALESYNNALKTEPNNAPALASIARLHYRQGKYQQASEFFRRALTNNPNDAELHNDLALTQSKLNDVDGAVASFEMALKMAPGTSRYANNLATVHYESGNPTAAYQVLSANNKPAVAHFNMAYLHYKAGKMDEAKQHLGASVKYEPQASSDAIVKRAVTRSREMLVQIDGATAPIAQAAPQATIAGGQFFNGPQTSPVQQTARNESSAPTVTSAPATAQPKAPATQAVTVPQTATGSITPPAPTYAAPQSSAGDDSALPPSWKPQPTGQMPAEPTIPNLESGASEASSGAESGAASGGFPFSLPKGFRPGG